MAVQGSFQIESMLPVLIGELQIPPYTDEEINSLIFYDTSKDTVSNNGEKAQFYMDRESARPSVGILEFEAIEDPYLTDTPRVLLRGKKYPAAAFWGLKESHFIEVDTPDGGKEILEFTILYTDCTTKFPSSGKRRGYEIRRGHQIIKSGSIEEYYGRKERLIA